MPSEAEGKRCGYAHQIGHGGFDQAAVLRRAHAAAQARLLAAELQVQSAHALAQCWLLRQHVLRGGCKIALQVRQAHQRTDQPEREERCSRLDPARASHGGVDHSFSVSMRTSSKV